MNNRRSSKHLHMRPTFEERYQALENALKQKHHTIQSPRYVYNFSINLSIIIK
jgi:hypothetical protein